MPEKSRRIDLIPAELRSALRGLVKGELPWPLFLFGPPGTGKTCAGLSLLDYSGGMYWTPATLSEDLILASKGMLHYASGRPIQQKALWKEIDERPLVVLDELATRAKVSDWMYDSIKRLIDGREGKPFVAISNMDLDQIAQLYDDRIASRLSAGTVFRAAGEDQRLRR